MSLFWGENHFAVHSRTTLSVHFLFPEQSLDVCLTAITPTLWSMENLHKTELDFEQKGLLYVALSASYVITHSNFAKLTGGDIQILYF